MSMGVELLSNNEVSSEYLNSESTTGADFDKHTYFKARDRIYAENNLNNAAPDLVCPQDKNNGKLSKFTASDTTNGNGALNGYKIGLLTVDEAAFAGGRSWQSDDSSDNNTFYLYTGDVYWLLSPSNYRTYTHFSSVWVIGSTGYLGDDYAACVYGVHPSVSLKTTTLVSKGTGTVSDPYIIGA